MGVLHAVLGNEEKEENRERRKRSIEKKKNKP